MKRIAITLSLIVLMFVSGISACADVGDVNGEALNTDIVAYINHYAIPSYAVNGQSVVVAEDLRNFGFDVNWNGKERTLVIIRNTATKANPMTVDKSFVSGSFFSNTLETDIKVFADDTQLTSYALNGYTMIPIEELTLFGSVNWVPEERAVKLWIDGLDVLSEKQPVTIAKHTMYNSDLQAIEVFSSEVDKYSAAGWYRSYSEAQQANNAKHYQSAPIHSYSSGIYRTPKGKRYHLDPQCGGKNSYSVTLEQAQRAGLTPCAKCAQ